MTKSQFGSVQYMSHDRCRVFWTAGGKRKSKVIHGTRRDVEAYLTGVARLMRELHGFRHEAVMIAELGGGLRPEEADALLWGISRPTSSGA